MTSPKFQEAYERFEKTHQQKYKLFQNLLDDFSLWGGKRVIPNKSQIKELRIQAEKNNKVEGYIIVREGLNKKGIFYKRYVDVRTGKYAKKSDYKGQFANDS